MAFLALASTAKAGNHFPTFQKSFESDTIAPGSISVLRFTIVNPGALPAMNLAFTDNLPSGVVIATPANPSSNCQGTLSAPAGGTTIALSGGALGGGRSCTITVQVTAGAAGTYNNVSGDLTSSAGNSGPAADDLMVVADRPSFSKSFGPNSVSLGGRSTLTFVIDNSQNPSSATNLTFTDNLPTGMEVADPANTFTDCTGGMITATPGGSVVGYSPRFFGDAAVAAGATCTVSVGVIGAAVGVLVNTTGDLTSTMGAQAGRNSGRASAALTVSVDPIALTKTFLNDPAAPGDTVNLRFTIRNLNRSSSAVDIEFTDDLDATLSGLAATGPLTDPCGPGSSLTGTDVLSLTGGNLDPEGVCTFVVALQVPDGAATGAFANTTSQISGEVDGSPVTGSPAADLLFVEPAPRLTKTFLDNPVGAGGSTELEFTIVNTSSTSNASEIAFVDVFDAILQTASAVPADGFCGASSTAVFTPAAGPNPAQLEIAGASLGPGESCTFSITLDVVVGAGLGTYGNITGAVTALVGDDSVTGRPASDDLDVVAAPGLRKEFTDDPVTAGETVTLQFTLIHQENSPDATGIAFSDDLAAVLPGLEAIGLPLADVCGAGSEISGTTNLQFSGGMLAPGETCIFSVTVQTPADAPPGPHTNTTSNVVATVVSETAVNIPASDDLQIAGLTLAKEFIDDPARPGGTVTLRFTISNVTAEATFTGIFFTDDLDDALAGLTATGLPLNDVCGSGSSFTGTAGNTFLTLQDGVLGPGESCTFDVVLDVPIDAGAETYINRTSDLLAMLDGTTLFFESAADQLTIVTEFLRLAKEFTDDPVGPGENVNLRFTLTNLDQTLAASDLAFTDDLGAALGGLASVSGVLNDVCGTGSQIMGTDVLSFSGGTLAPGASCSFDVTLLVPATVQLGARATNQTSAVTGMIGDFAVTGVPAVDDLQIDFLTFAKAFDGDAAAGGTVGLSFTIQNLDASNAVSELSFQDDLDAVLSGLTAAGLPANDVCGLGSVLDGTSLLTMMGGNLLPGGSCTFSVELQVPASATPGNYVNTTTDLLQFGFPIANPATAVLTVLGVTDEDGDGVVDEDDACPGTVIPEGVPTEELGVNRFALVDNDGIFDTVPPKGKGPQASFTINDTAGCSCEQIIVELNLGEGHRKFGCSLGAMRNWVDLVSPSALIGPQRSPWNPGGRGQ